MRSSVRDVASWVDAAVFAGVLGMIVVTPWFRGLFFPMEQMVALLAGLALFAARWWAKFSRNDYTFLRGPLDWAVFGLFLAYVASTFVAANVRAAIQEDIKYLLYFIVYWLVRELARDERRRAMVLGAVAVTGVWVSILGVGAAAGTFHYKGAFESYRIFSVFQYPNTLAAYLTVAFFCALTLWLRASTSGEIRRAWPTFLWAVAAYTSLFVFVFTYSRGALLVLPVVAATFVALQEKGFRLGGALLILSLALTVGLAGRGFPEAVTAQNAAGAWGVFLLGIPLALVANLILILFNRVPGRKRIIALGGLAGGGLAVAAFLLVYLRLPAKVLSNVSTISLADHNAWARIQWMKDALSIVRDYPFLGVGGGGWNAIYHQYQSYGYSSTEVHNHFMQTWVEAGTVGFLLFLMAWVLLGRGYFMVYKGSTGEDRVLVTGAAVGALALGLHSAIDFNLSLSAVSIALWGLFGTVESARIQAMANPHAGKVNFTGYLLWPRVVCYGSVFLVALGILSLLQGHVIGRQARAALNQGDLVTARGLYERAIQKDPFTGPFHMDLGQILASGSTDAVRYAMAETAMQRGIRLNVTNGDFHAIYGSIALRAGQLDKALAEFRKALELHPFNLNRYENLAQAEMMVASQLLLVGSEEEARKHLDEVFVVQKRLKEKAAEVPEPARPYAPLPEKSWALSLAVGQAQALSGDLRGAEQTLSSVAGETTDARMKRDAHLWWSQVLEVQGRIEESIMVLEPVRSDPNWEQSLGHVQRLITIAAGQITTK